MCGYGNALSFKDIEDCDINYVENFIRCEALSVCAKMFDESLGGDSEGLLDRDQMLYIFGTTHAATPDQFKFYAGDIATIRKLVKHVKGVVDGDGVNKGLYKFKIPKKEKENFIPYPWLNLTTKEHAAPRKNETCIDTVEMESRFSELKLELLRKTELCLTSYNVDESIIMSIEDDMIEVYFGKNGRIHGRILCVVCKIEKAIDSNQRVYYQLKKNSNHWIMANYLKHLKKIHGLIDTKKKITNRTACKKLSKKNILKPHNSGSTENRPDELNIKSDTVSNQSIDGEIEIIEEINLNLPLHFDQNNAYTQLTEQMTLMTGAVLINSESQQLMPFKLDGEIRNLMVSNIDGDGNCLFGAICHQLFRHPIGSHLHNNETVNLRACIVDHILRPEIFPSYEFMLKDRIYEIKKKENIENMSQECKLYVRHCLSLSGTWGGHETIVAAGEIYQVNVLLFNEKGGFYIANASQKMYDRTIALAYRLGPSDETTFNHYDSVTDVDSKLLFDIASHLAK